MSPGRVGVGGAEFRVAAHFAITQPQAVLAKNLSVLQQVPEQGQDKFFVDTASGKAGAPRGGCIDWCLVHSRRGSCLLKSLLGANGWRGQKLMGERQLLEGLWEWPPSATCVTTQITDGFSSNSSAGAHGVNLLLPPEVPLKSAEASSLCLKNLVTHTTSTTPPP